MATPRGKNRKKLSKKKFNVFRGNKLAAFFVVLAVAALGAYFVITSQAAQQGDIPSHSFNEYWNYGDFNNHVPQPGDTLKGTIDIDINNRPENTYTTTYQAIFITAYDTKVYKPMNGNCEWRFGCSVSSVNTAVIDAAVAQEYGNGFGVHKKRVAICFNIPANTNFRSTAFTYTLQRTSFVPNNVTSADNWVTSVDGHADGSCASNPSAAGFVVDTINDACGGSYIACDNGTGPGAGNGTLTGMGGTGNGTSGTGTGSKGIGTGAGGGGGSSANKQANKPNPVPSSTDQGTDKPQPKVEPDPFFDGKNFIPGSATDNLALGASTVAGKKIPNLVIYTLIVVLLAGVAGALYWRRKKKR